MASIKEIRSPPITNPDLLRDIISTIFPQVSRVWNLPTLQMDLDEILEVTTEEILEAVKKIAENEAPVKTFQDGSLKS